MFVFPSRVVMRLRNDKFKEVFLTEHLFFYY